MKRRSDMPALRRAASHTGRHSLGGLRRHGAHHMIGADVLADRLQPLQNALPLRPIQLPQERTKTLNERILEYRFAVCLRHEEAIQSDSKCFSNLFERAEAGGHLSAFDTGQIRT